MSLPYPEDVTIEVLNDADPELLLFESETVVEVLVGTTLETFDEATTEIVEVSEAPPGPPGPPGPGVVPFVFDQTTPSDTWSINHGFSYAPTVVLLDVDGKRTYTDEEHLPGVTLLHFYEPFTGQATLK